MTAAPRRPEGVILERASVLPPPAVQADARGVVALRQPTLRSALERLVRELLVDFQREDIDAIAGLLTIDATTLDGNPRGTRTFLLDQWRARLRTFDYSKVSGVELADFDRMQVFAEGELEPAGAVARPAEMRAGDLLVRVPIRTPRVGSEQLFPDEFVLLVRDEEGELKIAGVREKE